MDRLIEPEEGENPARRCVVEDSRPLGVIACRCGASAGRRFIDGGGVHLRGFRCGIGTSPIPRLRTSGFGGGFRCT
ncbi:hypothetical protein BG846_01821 [Streptomyces fradiae ATCC 10745 = DSM 40063]|uniref:Uncharacterized protein n=1 Tax=Streptomyces fradiae ATCC 10745 = DSM 40063 TaxID=1319510 RepID=A0A1Y2NYC7_STRFR|nr:hypothetical protein BG846_01821 [Streptomyces fradiae ATCC 10745 = DSM 40063]